MKRKHLAAAMALAISAGVGPMATAEQVFDGFVVFGDSLLDSGNFGAPFTNSGAQISPNILADRLGLALTPAITDPNGTNYAVGGYETPDVLNSISGTGISTFLGSRNAYLTDNPTVSADTLFFLDGGGNDFNPGGSVDWTTAPDPATAIQTSAATLVASVSALHAAGARYIMMANLPNMGNVPSVQLAELALPGTAASATAAAAGFNQALTLFTQQTNIRVIPVDLAGMLDLIARDADALGFANGVDLAITGAPIDQLYTCYDNGIAGVGASTSCFEHPVYGIDGSAPNPDQLVFNDGLHPTGATGQLNADYLYDILMAPRKVGLLPQMGIDAARAQLNTVTNEMRQSRWSQPQLGWFISGSYSVNEPQDSFDPEDENYSASIGVTLQLSENRLLGAAITTGYSELDVDGASFEANSYGLNVFYGYRTDHWFVDATVGMTQMEYNDLERDFNFGSQVYVAEGDTNGKAFSIDVSAGYNLLQKDDGYHFGPIVGIQSINSSVNRYRESGGEISNYEWGDQSTKSQQWRIGVAGSARLSERLTLHGEIYHSEELEDGWQTVKITNTNLGFSSYRLPGAYIDDDSFITANINGTLQMDEGKLQLTYHYSGQGEDSGQFSVGYSAAF